jgi:hypothetical protein
MHCDGYPHSIAASLVLRLSELEWCTAEENSASGYQREPEKSHRFEELTVPAGQRK